MKQTRMQVTHLFFLILPFVVMNYCLDNDTWFLLPCGKYVMEKGIPFIEPFSFHENFSYIMQQWLFASGIYTIYDKVGLIGLYLFQAVVFLFITVVLYRLCMRLSGGNRFVVCTVMVVSQICMARFVFLRPLPVTVCILLTALYCMERYMEDKKTLYLLPLPLLSILLINIHASMWLMLLCFTLPYIAEYLFDRVFYQKKLAADFWQIIVAFVATFLAGVINPYGITAMTYVFRSYGVDLISQTIKEMKPLNLHSLEGLLLWSLIIAAMLIILLYKKGSVRPRFVCLGLGTFYLAVSSGRSMPLLLLLIPVILSVYLRDFSLPRPIRISKFEKTVLAIGVAAILVFSLGSVYVKGTKNIEEGYPPSADLLLSLKERVGEENLQEVRLWIDYNNGPIAEFLEIPVYIDARAETFIQANNGQKDVFTEFILMEYGRIHYQDVLNTYRFTHVYAEKNDFMYEYMMHEPSYQLIGEDETGRLFERCDYLGGAE